MAKLFEEMIINGMKLSNRMVRSATWEGMCDEEGRPTEKLMNCYRDLAKGGVGLIVSGYAFVRKDGKQLLGKMGMHTDELKQQMKRLTAAVHQENGKIAVQLVHAGGQVKPSLTGQHPVAPSAIKTEMYEVIPKELSVIEIKEIVTAFGEAAARAREFGFDAVQLHGAHGYLISQFLSPFCNHRTDDYGGDIVSRCKVLMDIYRTVRKAVGKDFPVMVKLNGSDFLENGLSEGGALFAAKLLDREGIDAIEVSGGTGASGKKTPVRTKINSLEFEAYNLIQAKGIKGTVKCQVMAVGGFRNYQIAQKAIEDNFTDFISMSRHLIYPIDGSKVIYQPPHVGHVTVVSSRE